jgi:hypothetical protein
MAAGESAPTLRRSPPRLAYGHRQCRSAARRICCFPAARPCRARRPLYRGPGVTVVTKESAEAWGKTDSTRFERPLRGGHEAGGDIHPISRPNLLSPEEGRRSKPESRPRSFVHLCRERWLLSSDVEDKFLELGRTFCSVRPFSRADDVDRYRRCAGQDFPCFRPPDGELVLSGACRARAWQQRSARPQQMRQSRRAAPSPPPN